MRRLVVLLIGLVVLSACKKDQTTFQPSPYFLEIPDHFPDMIIPADNPMTQEGVDLGRWLERVGSYLRSERFHKVLLH